MLISIVGNFDENDIINKFSSFNPSTTFNLFKESIIKAEFSKLEKDVVNSQHVYLSGNDDVKATVKIENGEVVSYKVNGCEGIKREEEIVNSIPCQYNGNLVQGAEYKYGSFTYKYI